MEPFLYELQKAAFTFVEFSAIFYIKKKSYKLRNINMTEENTLFRHKSSSLGKNMGDSMFRTASIHDRIFFSGICRCFFWDEGHEDNSAKCLALHLRGKWTE